MSVLLKNQTSAGLHTALAPLGVSLRLTRRLQAVVLREDRFPSSLPEVSPALLDRIRSVTSLPRLDGLAETVSPRDGFAKFLFRGHGPETFESVRIPLLHRPGQEKSIVCASSQVGCAMDCAFCATGRMGFVRNLAAWEMVDQVIQIAARSPHPVRGVVFMGMGEPLLNYDEVIRAAQILCEPCGLAIAAKSISISTVGIIPAIRRYAAERHPFRLIVSLSSADPARRREILPAAAAHPLPDLIDALREVHRVSRQRVTLAWTMISGFNTREEDAIQLAALLHGLPVTLDLIDVQDPSGRFQPPSPAELNAFRDALRRHLAMPVRRRYSGGTDISAGCGMLATSSPST